MMNHVDQKCDYHPYDRYDTEFNDESFGFRQSEDESHIDFGHHDEL